MLSAFKEAGLKVKDDDEGVLVPFYAFYDTIKEFLNPSISRVIEGAYQNPTLKDDEFNISLLKVLFMVKYIKELPANIDNLVEAILFDTINQLVPLNSLFLRELSISNINGV